jgi:hypothetical protein
MTASKGHGPLTWQSWREAVRIVVARDNLRRTIVIALIVGTLLFAINQLDVVVAGHATPIVWTKIGVTFLVPFGVANAGVLAATHRRIIQ